MESRSWFRMLEAPRGAQLQALLDFAAARRAHYPTFLLVQREAAPGQTGDAAAFASHAPPLAPAAHKKRAANRAESDAEELIDPRDLIDSLEPHLITQATTDSWPGAAPGESRARVLFYRLDPQSALALSKVSSLAAFVPPLPEDLSVLSTDKTPWLLTQSRAQKFLLHLTPEEERALGKSLPWLRLEREAEAPL